MIAVDSNILIYAHRKDSPHHAGALALVRELVEGSRPWTIPWPCVHEFLSIVTHPKIYRPATALDRALEQISEWMGSAQIQLIGEERDYWNIFTTAVIDARVVGPQIHDARIAALCRLHGVTELWTADRHFGRFAGITTKNPLAPR